MWFATPRPVLVFPFNGKRVMVTWPERIKF